MLRRLLTAAAFFAVPNTASASLYLFSANGTAASFYSVDEAFDVVPNPPASIAPGDPISVSFNLDVSNRAPEGLFAADPSINIYYAGVTNLTISVGRFTYAAAPGVTDYGEFQLWDNHYVSSVGYVDSLTFSAGAFMPSALSPISLGSGQVLGLFHFNAFDMTALARLSDSIEEQPPLTAYGSRSASVGFINTASYLQTVVSISDLRASLVAVPSVPEPDTWALLVIGFGLTGAVLRQRDKQRRLVRRV